MTTEEIKDHIKLIDNEIQDCCKVLSIIIGQSGIYTKYSPEGKLMFLFPNGKPISFMNEKRDKTGKIIEKFTCELSCREDKGGFKTERRLYNTIMQRFQKWKNDTQRDVTKVKDRGIGR
ncbi:hypothetical protein N752_25190 [Desulforamulus aquiferis]|nr:hypothetical protein [Desulforamulus aquiferis]RYD02626.1 hypothetical protein N752_25190 [Desulforamulus aquiferis]